MTVETSRLPNDVASLKEIILSLKFSHAELERSYKSQVNILEEQVRFLRDKLFGRKSEKFSQEDDPQMLLFDTGETEASSEDASAEPVQVPAHTRGKKGRKPLPDNLPRVDVVHDLQEEEKICGCGCIQSRIGEEVSEKLDIIPARIQVIRTIRYKYACKSCEGVESEGGAVKIAPVPPQIIPKSIATPGLLSYLLTSKYVDALPFYRQEKLFERIGVELPRATMSNWAIQAAKQCAPLISLLQKEIRSGPLVNIDETTVQVLREPGRPNTSKSYMWVFRGGPPDSPSLIYQYHPGRSGEVALEFLKEYQGYIQTDGFSGYEALGERPGILHVGCWAHARRKFVEVVNARKSQKNLKNKTGSADKAVDYIRQLYAIEKQAKDKKLDVEGIYRLRRENAVPILREFREWLSKRILQTPPKGLLGKAMAYTLNHWEKLARYVEDGRLSPDNNLAENAIRPFVIGRKNWLFSGNPTGAQASADLYSLIETAKANGLEPYQYLRVLFEKLPLAKTREDYKSLLPQFIQPNA